MQLLLAAIHIAYLSSLHITDIDPLILVQWGGLPEGTEGKAGREGGGGGGGGGGRVRGKGERRRRREEEGEGKEEGRKGEEGKEGGGGGE